MDRENLINGFLLVNWFKWDTVWRRTWSADDQSNNVEEFQMREIEHKEWLRICNKFILWAKVKFWRIHFEVFNGLIWPVSELDFWLMTLSQWEFSEDGWQVGNLYDRILAFLIHLSSNVLNLHKHTLLTAQYVNISVYVYSLISLWVQQTSPFTPLLLELSLTQFHLLWEEFSIYALLLQL